MSAPIDVVISGLSGRFPECENVEEFRDKLFSGIDMVTEDDRRWPVGLYGLPKRNGKIKDLSHFDASYFGISPRQAQTMDPQARILLEVTHEALIDAGVNPLETRGTRTAVFASGLEMTSETIEKDPDEIDGYEVLGENASLLANRLSYYFDWNGPNFNLQSACSTSIYAIHYAYEAIKKGDCDAAIVATSNMLYSPNVSLGFAKNNLLSPDGICKPFNDSPTGYVRSEAIVVVYIQKSSAARRIYATIMGSRLNTDGYKELATMPSGIMQNRLYRELYEQESIDPEDISFIEAHGTGTQAGDVQEINGIADYFCENRKEPLMIGSVKSNMGHGEIASGLCSLAKMILSMETGIIPANLHFEIPNPEIPALCDGRMEVVTRNRSCDGDIMAINCFGMGGTNSHLVLKPNYKSEKHFPAREIPRIVGVSGRTEEAVNHFLNKIVHNKDDEEFLTLVDKIHSWDIKGHPFRGYVILNEEPLRQVAPVKAGMRQIWFLYSGLGSQWPGMVNDLMKFEIFRTSIRKCTDILRPYGVMLEDILNSDGTLLSDISNSIFAIVSFQMALTDLLFSVGILPDGVVGHSAGETLCAYADGALTYEQTLLVAYKRVVSVHNCNDIPENGSMAAVSLSKEETEKRCPPDVFIACENSDNNITVSGPRDSICSFVTELESENIFAKIIKPESYAFHSKYIAPAGEILRKDLQEVIPHPKMRTSRWISSSIPESKWNTPLAQYASADYFVNNLLSPVLLRDALRHIPENSIIIEIAPSSLMQGIITRSAELRSLYMSFNNKDNKDNATFFLSSLGKLYNAGVQPKFSKLYAQIDYPVGRGTTGISSMVKWDHSSVWPVPTFANKRVTKQLEFKVDLKEEPYLAGHKVNGKIIYPGAGYLVLAWKGLAKVRGKNYEQMPIVFRNVKFIQASLITDEPVKFTIHILEGSGDFEITSGDAILASGTMYVPEDTKEIKELENDHVILAQSGGNHVLSKSDIYRDIRLRGYEHSGLFCGIIESDVDWTYAKLKWEENWVTFIDSLLQVRLFYIERREFYILSELREMIIDPKKHLDIVKSAPEGGILTIPNRHTNVFKSGGIIVRNIEAKLVPQRPTQKGKLSLQKYQWLPYQNHVPFGKNETIAKRNALSIICQIVQGNNPRVSKLKITEFCNNSSVESNLSLYLDQLGYLRVPVEATVVTSSSKGGNTNNTINDNYTLIQTDMKTFVPRKYEHIIIIHSDMTFEDKSELISNILPDLSHNTFILLEESRTYIDSTSEILEKFEIVSIQVSNERVYTLFRKISEAPVTVSLIEVTESNFSWIEHLKKKLEGTNEEKIYLFTKNEKVNGLIGLVNCLLQELDDDKLRSFLIDDECAAPFSLKNYTDQIRKDLVHNVLKNDVWGMYCHLDFDDLMENTKTQSEDSYIEVLNRGDLSSLCWVEAPPPIVRSYDDPKKELCSVYFASLNLRDVMWATGQLNPLMSSGSRDCELGLEFSGRDSKGKRVMGIATSKCFATTMSIDPDSLLEVPADWSMEEAATIPVVYATVYYALIIRGKMQHGESILIHAGAGGVGIAAITIALHMGCEVFTTVDSRTKRDFLKKRFPKLSDENIGYSRNADFEELVLTQTQGRGVDLVLNSLPFELQQASIRSLANGGRFLEINQVDMLNNSLLHTSVFLKNISFHGVFLDNNSYWRDSHKAVMELMKEGIKNAVVKPLPRTIFEKNQAEQAFRFMASAKHIGKVVLKIKNEENRKVCLPKVEQIMSAPRVYMNSNKSYIIIGGLGGFGMELSNWLISRGARNIMLVSRRGVSTGYQVLRLKRWKEYNINVLVSTSDVSTEDGSRSILQEAHKMGPIGGIFNLALVLHDALFINQSEATFKTVCEPKIDATSHFDVLSRELAPELDHFVLFSSVVGSRGNAGQCNYGFANCAAERICETRQEAGLPGLAIQWGPIGDVGYFFELMGDNEKVMMGALPQRITSCFQVLDFFFQQSNPVVASMVVAEKHAKETMSGPNLIESVLRTLGIKDVTSVPTTSSLADLGIDSIMGTDLKKRLEHNYGIILTTKEIRALTIEKLTEMSSSKPKSTSSNEYEKSKRILPTSCLKLLPSKSIDELNMLFFLHPVEGLVDALETVAKNIETSVYGLECTSDVPHDSMKKMAEYYISQIKSIRPKGPYVLAGYSFGASIIMEIGMIMEKNQEQVKLICIDGSPKYSIALMKRYSKILSIECAGVEFGGLVDFIQEIVILDKNEIASELKDCKTYDKGISTLAQFVSGKTVYSNEEWRQTMDLFQRRMGLMRDYIPEGKFSGEVILIKCNEGSVCHSEELKKDYGLSEICSGNIVTYTVEGDHSSIMEIPASVEKMADVINQAIRAN